MTVAALRQRAVSSSPTVWAQVGQVRAALDGPRWRQTFQTATAGLPSWLVALVDGRVDGYTGPDPVLFRTAGIGLEWFEVLADHPEQLRVTCAHDATSAAALQSAAQVLADAGAEVDADAYVWGSGTDRFCVRIHRLFGVFPAGAAVPATWDALSTFVVTERRSSTTTVEAVPRLVVPEGWV